jgi:hypothetical protein
MESLQKVVVPPAVAQGGEYNRRLRQADSIAVMLANIQHAVVIENQVLTLDTG